jgi:phosphate transport system substrate-binding protein
VRAVRRYLIGVSLIGISMLIISYPSRSVNSQATSTLIPTLYNSATPTPTPYSTFPDGEADTLVGSGATFPLNLYLNWAKLYKDRTHVSIIYSGGGSGKGRQDIVANSVDFAGTDFPMSDDELKAAKGGEMVHIVSAIGSVAIIYNIPELQGKPPLKLTGDEIAKIYMGEIKKWNDPILVTDNPNLANVDTDIVPYYRQYGSADITFENYLILSNSQLAAIVKSQSQYSQLTFNTAGYAQGSPGLASIVKARPYGMSYTEFAFTPGLQVAAIQDHVGNYILPDIHSTFQSAVGLDYPEDLRLPPLLQSLQPDAYPIAHLTWLVVYTDQKIPSKALALTRFLWWAVHDGQKYSMSLGYGPLPPQLVQRDEAQILKIKVNGVPVLATPVATP